MKFCGVLTALLALASRCRPTDPAAMAGASGKRVPRRCGSRRHQRRFRDGDGDGRDDVSGKVYAHRFLFADQNKDGVNDLFVDRDGDGVNDLDAECGQSADGGCANVVDQDRNGVNDITGLRYTRNSLRGYRYGRIAEELRQPLPRFVSGWGWHERLLRRHFNRLNWRTLLRPLHRRGRRASTTTGPTPGPSRRNETDAARIRTAPAQGRTAAMRP
jgi:hypothetical protein